MNHDKKQNHQHRQPPRRDPAVTAAGPVHRPPIRIEKPVANQPDIHQQNHQQRHQKQKHP